MPTFIEEPPPHQTFSAFEGDIRGNKISSVSIIQEGPALGHGVWVDSTMLEQVAQAGKRAKKVKAKQNHWSGVEDTIGYYSNFRVQDGKVLADLTLFESSAAVPLLLEMIGHIPETFGVSISFQPAPSVFDEKTDRYNARLQKLLSADFVDIPAANRDGVFEAITEKIDNPEINMTIEAFDAFKLAHDARIAALESQGQELLAKLDALAAKFEKPETPTPAPAALEAKPEEKPDDLSAQLSEALILIKALAAAPVTAPAPVAPPQAPMESEENVKTRAQFDALSHEERNKFFAEGGKIK